MEGAKVHSSYYSYIKLISNRILTTKKAKCGMTVVNTTTWNRITTACQSIRCKTIAGKGGPENILINKLQLKEFFLQVGRIDSLAVI